jgi:hypothetical protein
MANTTEGRILKTIENRANIGDCGSVFIDDTSEHTGPFVAFTALAESTLDVSACITRIEDAADVAIPAGVTIFGRFESLAFTAGAKVLAYKRCEK